MIASILWYSNRLLNPSSKAPDSILTFGLPTYSYIPVLSDCCMLVFLCVNFLCSLFFVLHNKFLSLNDVFKVPEVKKKVPEKKVIIPKKEEVPPAKGTALPKQIRHCHFFLHL